MKRALVLATTALLFVTFIPLVDAHAAPVARSFETRVMHDHNDDSVFLTAQGKHGFDAIALDVREGFDLGTGPVVVFRLLLNGGCNANAPSGCPELSHVVKFNADGAEKSVTFTTPDGGDTWTGDAARFEGPFDINDGTRFAIEAWVPMAQLGVLPGSALTDWFVEGYAGTESADNMPQGAVPGVDDPLGAAFVIDSYTVKAPDYYLNVVAGPTTVEASAGTEVTWSFDLSNLQPYTQTVTFSTVGLDADVTRNGVVVTEELAPNVTRTYDVVLTPEQSGSVTVIVTSDFGGASAVAFAVDVPVQNTGLNVMGPDVAAGGNFSHTFGVMGAMDYHDHNNPVIGGKVIVGMAGNVTTHVIRYDGEAFTPAELTIGMGDTVIWQNDSEGTMMIMGSGSGHDHGDHGHGDHDHGAEGDDKESPGVPTLLVALGLLGAVLIARRR